MNSIILDLQQEISNSNCDVLSVLRKAHLIASKLKLTEFDNWIQNELNGYTGSQDDIPDYRKVKGNLKALNPNGSIRPVIIPDNSFEELLTKIELRHPISQLLELLNGDGDDIEIVYFSEISQLIRSMTNVPIGTEFAIEMPKDYVKLIIDKVINSLLDWTIKLENEGILGENMQFSEEETKSAQIVTQQVNNYYGNVIVGNISDSQIVSGDNNHVNFNYEKVAKQLDFIKSEFNNQDLDSETKEEANELIDDISDKIKKNKKPVIIKSALRVLKDFLISTGCSVLATLISNML